MSDSTQPNPESLEASVDPVRAYLSRVGQKGGLNQPRSAKVKGGKAGAKSRWHNRPLCPTCFQPATKAQVKAKNFITKAQLESRKLNQSNPHE